MPFFANLFSWALLPSNQKDKKARNRRQKLSLAFEQLEQRRVLSADFGIAVADVEMLDMPEHAPEATAYYAEGTNWVDFNYRQHNKHIDHVSWDPDPLSDGLIDVTVLIHDHGNLSADKLARLQDAVTEVNSAQAVFGANLHLSTVTDVNQTHQIHLHEDTTSGCGSNALGCAEFSIYIKHSGKYDDGHGNHLYAGEDVGGTAEATLLSGFNWYAGADASQIGGTQYDYQTVATQELLHLVGVDHDSAVYDSDPEVAENTDHRSVMHGSLGTGIVRRLMSTHDQELLTHLYGPGQTSNDGGDGGDSNGKGPPPGKGKNKLAGEFTSAVEQTPASGELLQQVWINFTTVQPNIGSTLTGSATLPEATIPQDSQQILAPATGNVVVAALSSDDDFDFLRDVSEDDDDLLVDADETLLPLRNAHPLALVEDVPLDRLD